VSDASALVLEIVAAFLFLLVILTVVTDRHAAWSGVQAPVAIGAFAFIGIAVIGPNSGGAFNPARSLAPALVDGSWSHPWLYLVAPLAGAVIAGAVHLAFRVADAAEPRTATRRETRARSGPAGAQARG
jgi:glycerol uptake facilitator-like aquaporin